MNPPRTRATAPMENTQAGSKRPHRRVKDMIAVNFGNALEWYDWNVYTIFAPVFAAQIFRSGDPTSDLLATLAVFAVGFVARPVGGFLFGAYADRVGRKKSLFVAMLITAGGSLMIALTPTFETAGVLAAVMLVTARLVQGLAHGGEMGTAVTYLVERAPDGRRALFGATSWVSVILGTMIATLVGLGINAMLTPEQVAAWGWRLAFGLGGVLGLYALYLRRSIAESETFTQSLPQVSGGGDTPAATVREDVDRTSRRFGARSVWAGLAVIFAVSAGGSLMFYTWLIYLPTYAQVNHGMSPQQTLGASLVAQLVFLAAIIGAGLLGDRVGRKPMVIVFGAAFVVLPFVLFRLLDGGVASFLLVQIVALVAIAALFGVNGAVWSEVLPVRVRAKGVAATLSLATAVFGGTAPYVITWLAQRDLSHVFSWYLAAIAAVTLAAGLLMRETRHADLTL
ncbi:MFS transporter [Micrococcus flavus]